MNLPRRVILMTFIESFATICTERGIYFYSDERLGFSGAMNLWMALAFGAVYAGGAMLSHRLAVRLGERRLLTAALAGQLVVHLALAAWPTPASIFVGLAMLGLLNGLKWPVLESYVSAGQTPLQAAKTIGLFNMAWASAVPLALGAAGPLIAASSSAIFLVPAAINLAAILMCRPLPRSPVHLAADHPERPAPAQMLRLKSLLNCSRWLMLGSYASMWILAALLPGILKDLGLGVSAASGISGALDVMRVATFLVLWAWPGWHGRSGLLLVSLAGLPGAFFLVMFGGSLPAVLAGEVLFGVCAGMVYNAALFYALVVKNASVDAGGGHEGLIGAGFAIGPIAGLIGVGLATRVGTELAGMIVGIGPVFLACSGAALWSLRGMRASRPLDPTG